jgi:hypothetical protein
MAGFFIEYRLDQLKCQWAEQQQEVPIGLFQVSSRLGQSQCLFSPLLLEICLPTIKFEYLWLISYYCNHVSLVVYCKCICWQWHDMPSHGNNIFCYSQCKYHTHSSYLNCCSHSYCLWECKNYCIFRQYILLILKSEMAIWKLYIDCENTFATSFCWR